MVKVRNIFGDEYSGQAGKAGVFAKWKGRQYRRKYVIPSNPRTAKQTSVRNSFKAAVNMYHAFSSLQRLAYDYMVAGKTMSGFNLIVSRWQKMSDSERAAYVPPYEGIKQIGVEDMLEGSGIQTAQEQATYSTEEIPIVIGETMFTPATTGVSLVAYISALRGRIDIVSAPSDNLKIDYTSGGREITGEVIEGSAGKTGTFYTKYWPIDYKNVHIYDGETEVDGLVTDELHGYFTFTNTAPGDNSGAIDFYYYTPVADAKLEVKKVDTNFITWRDYSDETGIIKLAQTSEDGNRDLSIVASGYLDYSKANISPDAAAKTEYIALEAVGD
ncbi:hypothetical protein DRZ78_00005 [Candidatus Aerophobetes bacterium]|uniref:Uncharacterized protein n=1 Tax=Aerophobetes bacterium TaxID=2030807 RepID=A0A662D2E9_UNCAE|nr:MAG: hypothetical protein DRZ78_00005 [Candidatus Aerophobetes bacterium]